MEIAKIVKEAIHFVNEMEDILYYEVDSCTNEHGILKPLYKPAKAMRVQIQSFKDSLVSKDILPNNQASCVIYFEINNDFLPHTLANAQNESADVIMRQNGEYWLLTEIIEQYSHGKNDLTGHIACLAVLQPSKPEGIPLDGNT